MRHILELDLPTEILEIFRASQKALDHDEPEQTFQLMTHLLSQAISLTSKDNPIVRLYTRDPQRASFTHVVCPHCQQEVPIVHQVSDGFRESAVKLQ